MADDTVDVERLMDEIDDEVQRRRDDGELDPAFEHELDELFSPGGTGRVGDYARLIDEAQRAAQIDATPPAASQLVGGVALKRALGRSMSWYVGSIARQVSTLGSDLVEVVRLLGARVAKLEEAAEQYETPAGGEQLGPHLDPMAWRDAITGALEHVTGRVVHADAGDGSLVDALLAAGLDAYGVEPRVALAERASMRGVDVREEGVLDHVRALPSASLAGLVVSGCADTLPNGDRQRLVRSARRVLAPDGRLVVLASDPGHWGNGATRVVADLAPGRPWSIETWTAVLADGGFAVAPAVPDGDDTARVLVAVRRPA
jgi:SAM-dependent methyltransferase